MNQTPKLQNFIDGKFVDPRNGQYLDSFNPATGKAFLLVPDSDAEDVNDAVSAAKKVSIFSRSKGQFSLSTFKFFSQFC